MKRSLSSVAAVLAALVVLSAPAPAAAKDFFVRAGSDGDGSREKPFKDPYLALEKAEAGDTIHVAGGVYHGRLDTANWVIDVPNLTWLGGYSADFTERDPWKNPTELRFVKDFKGRNGGSLVANGKDATGFTLDGFVCDQRERNAYGGEKEDGDIDFLHTAREDLVDFRFTARVTVKNCLLINGSQSGLVLRCDAALLENNIIMNMAGPYLVGWSTPPPGVLKDAKVSAVRGNTFLFSWSPNYGQGGPDGVGSHFFADCKAEFTANVFMNCDNHALFLGGRTENYAVKDNVFWMNGYSNVKFFVESRDVAVDNANMGELEDVGLKACEGNSAEDPGFAGFDPTWMAKFINRSAAERGKVTMDDWNKMRQLMGLPLQGEGGKGPSGYAMWYDWKKAHALVPKCAAGAHPRKLEVKLAAPGAAAAEESYEPVAWDKVFKEDAAALDGKRVELVVAFGGEKSQYYWAGFNEKEHMGVELYDAKAPAFLGNIVYFKKGTNVGKMVEKARPWRGSAGDTPDSYLARAIVKHDPASNMRCKATLLLVSVEPFVEKKEKKARPEGRDWFVRAGASGGKGTKEKPFKDPWQALEQCEKGDVIHVAEGEYFGKLKVGYWTIDTRYLTMRGGYSKDFAERDPWKHPTRLGFSADAKAWTSGAYIRFDGDHTGFVFDGFVLDGKDVNKYEEDGDLIPGKSSRCGLIELGSPECEVRNCVLVNGSLGSVSFGGADNAVIENNIMLNFHWQSIQLTPIRNDVPYVVRGNTLLFSWYDRADGTGRSPQGTSLYTRGDCALVCDANIIGFNDVQGIFTSSKPPRIELTNNVFVKNLFAHFHNGQEIAIDDKAMGKLPDCGFAKLEGNTCDLDPQLPFAKAWMDQYVQRTMRVPGKVTEDEWNKYRALIGQPQIATGGKAADVYCRVYDWREALQLFPANPACKAGARPVKLEAKFSGKAPAAAESKAYAPVEFKVLQKECGSVEGKDVEMVGMFGEIRSATSYGYLDEVKNDDWALVQLMGPEGKESGFPVNGYFRRDTRIEKAVKKSDGLAKYRVRGTAKKGSGSMTGCLLIESVEKLE